MNVKAMGRAGLSGPRGRLGERAASAVADRTRFTQKQVAAVIGGLLLAWSLYRTTKLLRSVVRAGRSGSA